MTVSKGFGKVDTSKLIEGWLLPELKHNLRGNKMNLRCLKTSLCLMVSHMSLRKFSKKDLYKKNGKVAEIAANSCAILATLDIELETSYKEVLQRLRVSDSFYIEYVNKLYSLAEWKVKNDLEISDYFVICDDIKVWKQEMGHLVLSTPKLAKGWMHPLSDTMETDDGQVYLNSWLFASTICGIACKRYNDGSVETCISTLISMGVLQLETMTARLKICRYLDEEYLKLISECQEAFNNQAQQANQ